MFDTGAYASLLSVRAAARAGVKIDSPGVIDAGISRGIGPGMVRSYIAPFASFKFADGEEIKNARLRIADIDLETTDMLIGADFFLSHRVFVANSQDQLYFTYNGGPVFNLKTAAPPPISAGADTASDAPAKPAPAAASNAAEAPADAAALARRGSASAGRLDFDAALADFMRACELEPNNPEYIYQRGRVYWQKKDRDKAMADFDRALELKPDYVAALLNRAEMRLNAKNTADARADLEAIDKIVAKQSDVRYEMAFEYERANLWPAAIAQFDLWITAHQEDSRLVLALSGRCRAKGILGQDLAGALKDCNTAVSRSVTGTNAAVLGNQALVRFRLGDYDKSIADYDAALRLQPNVAWNLYGRGLAKLKAKKAKEGEADLAEAAKISPTIADSYQKLGFAP
jgi:tetratricopeptide (TPR) repeat protein